MEACEASQFPDLNRKCLDGVILEVQFVEMREVPYLGRQVVYTLVRQI
jgi:hypothetical protein